MSFTVPANYRILPAVWEMSQPFNIDANGTVGYDTDPMLWARNHILALLLTNPGERVMRPTYGAGLAAFIFENDDPLAQQTILNNIQMAVNAWEPSITIQTLEFKPSSGYSGLAVLDLHYTVGISPRTYTITFTLGGTGIEVVVP